METLTLIGALLVTPILAYFMNAVCNEVEREQSDKAT